jgi:hypothetical protein
MEQLLKATSLILIAVVPAWQQGSAAGQSLATASKPQVLQVQLFSSLNSAKLKEGDLVLAVTPTNLEGRVVNTIPPKSRMVGHITEAKARSKGDAQSRLGIVFDKIKLEDGREAIITGHLRAVGPNPSHKGFQNDRAFEPPKKPSSDVSSLADSRRQLPVVLVNQESQGVLNIPGLQLGADGVLTSTEKEVRLDPAMQITVQVIYVSTR